MLESLLLSLDLQPPDLDAIEEEFQRQRAAEEEGGASSLSPRGPLEGDNATAASLLSLPAFVEALTLQGVDAAARVVAPLMAQLNQQAQSLASQLELPSAQAETERDRGSSRRPTRRLPRTHLLEQRNEFLLLLNAIERRLMMVSRLLLRPSLSLFLLLSLVMQQQQQQQQQQHEKWQKR